MLSTVLKLGRSYSSNFTPRVLRAATSVSRLGVFHPITAFFAVPAKGDAKRQTLLVSLLERLEPREAPAPLSPPPSEPEVDVEDLAVRMETIAEFFEGLGWTPPPDGIAKVVDKTAEVQDPFDSSGAVERAVEEPER